ncbi:putative damage-inducible protein DinB [Peribacillus deserti]|uniref:Damage-inducible protein DinB n=1 Tax=Peribacillus deserti TaxID=673318 RepID=A0ABS2QKZ1_9BACI|nr:DinB family protein [Peribacillus deserti]MBM7693845.1 putative damage-inducible protein DinB [Peribacillus deserti]
MSKANRFLHYFLSHRDVTNELISKIGKEHYQYQPTETSMPASKLATHILESFYKFAAAAKEGHLAPFQEKVEEESDLQKLAEIYTDKTRQILESLSDRDLEREIDVSAMVGRNMTARQFLQLALDHEVHHKGALFVYVREMGHTDLPMFMKRS